MSMIINPYRFGSPPWTPSNLASPSSIWLDDSSAVTDVSGAASEWFDLSGNGFDFTQTTAGNRPTILTANLNGKRVLSFDGVDDHLDSTGPARQLFQNVGSGWFFSVYKKRVADVATTARVLLYFSVPSGASRFNVQVNGPAVDTPSLNVRRLDADSTSSLNAGATSSAAWVMRLDTMLWSSGDGTIYLNGQQSAQNLSLTTSGNTSNTTSPISSSVGLGAQINGSNPSGVDIAASLVGVALPTPTEVDKLFGWAAWRYGLQGNLPIGHPYKNAPPTI